MTTVVVGAGLFGATIARALAAEGRKVRVLDNNLTGAASPASGSLMKPSWFSGMGPATYKPALAMLHRLYQVATLKFNVGLFKADVLHVPTGKILSIPKEEMGVEYLIDDVNGKTVVRARCEAFDEVIEADLVVVAAGIWTEILLPQYRVDGRAGISARWVGTTENRIAPWAPYKQMVKFQESEIICWAGDGSAIIPDNWNQEREDKSKDRVSSFAKVSETVDWTYGVRPYVAGAKPCLVERVRPGLWVATGGAKNGLVAAGWAAHVIVEGTK